MYFYSYLKKFWSNFYTPLHRHAHVNSPPFPQSFLFYCLPELGIWQIKEFFLIYIWLFLNKFSLETIKGTYQISRLTSILDSLLKCSHSEKGNCMDYWLPSCLALSHLSVITSSPPHSMGDCSFSMSYSCALAARLLARRQHCSVSGELDGSVEVWVGFSFFRLCNIKHQEFNWEYLFLEGEWPSSFNGCEKQLKSWKCVVTTQAYFVS